MGCNCKNDTNISNIEINNKNSLIQDIGLYTAKLIGFSIGLILLPLIMLVVAWIMFETIVLNRNIDLRKLVDVLLKTQKKEVDDDDDDDDILTEEDVVMLNVEDITKN